jgi:hypothetical protein
MKSGKASIHNKTSTRGDKASNVSPLINGIQIHNQNGGKYIVS